MNLPAGKGSKITKREALEQVQKSKRKKNASYNHPELTLPELPQEIRYLWKWYSEELQNGERLSWQEIQAWSEITGVGILDLEAKALRKLSFIHQNLNNQLPQ